MKSSGGVEKSNGIYGLLEEIHERSGRTEREVGELAECLKENNEKLERLVTTVEVFLKYWKTSAPIQVIFYIFAIVALLIAGVKGAESFIAKF